MNTYCLFTWATNPAPKVQTIF